MGLPLPGGGADCVLLPGGGIRVDFARNKHFGSYILCKINELEHDHVLKSVKMIITEDFSHCKF